MKMLALLVLAQAGLLALHHFGEADLFWTIVLEVFWGGLLVLWLIGRWAEDTWGTGT